MSEKRLVRSNSSDRMVAGVATGLAAYFNVDPTFVRLAFVLFTLAGGPGLIAYILLWLVMPEVDFVGTPSSKYDDSEDIIIEKGG